MPRGKKNKRRARMKRHQAQGEAQHLKGAQAAEAEAEAEAEAAAAGEESPSSPSSVSQGTPPSSPAAGPGQEPQGAPATGSPEAGVSGPGAEGGAQAAPSTQSTRRDPLIRKASMLVQYLLEKYKMKEPITQAAMLKAVNKKYKEHFPEILRMASEQLELVLGLELKEVDRSNHYYTLTSKLDLPSEGGPSDEGEQPQPGLLMMLLAVIFMKGNRATEEEIWKFLSVLGVYAGRRHLIFGEPGRLIKDLVQQKYLKYRQVPDSNPPRYEFLWGPRAHAEISKMKALEVLAKINDTVPSSFPDLYEEALKDEKERAGMRAAARAAATAEGRAPSRAKSHSSPHV